jgi:hypothetical protein
MVKEEAFAAPRLGAKEPQLSEKTGTRRKK